MKTPESIRAKRGKRQDDPKHETPSPTPTSPAPLPLSQLKVDPTIQVRVHMSKVTVEEYGRRMRAGDRFPPLVAFYDGTTCWLSDGFHRVAAAKSIGLAEFPVDVRAGTRADAVRFALSANAAHGLRRTNADKRRAVQMALGLDECANMSDRALGEICNVSYTFVSRVRSELPTVGSSGPRIGLDGKTRKLPTRPAPPQAIRPTNLPPDRAYPVSVSLASLLLSAQQLIEFAGGDGTDLHTKVKHVVRLAPMPFRNSSEGVTG